MGGGGVRLQGAAMLGSGERLGETHISARLMCVLTFTEGVVITVIVSEEKHRTDPTDGVGLDRRGQTGHESVPGPPHD